MKIVHVESGRHLYGGAQQVRYLLDGLARQGVDNVLLCTEGAAIGGAVRAARSADVVELPIGGDLDFGAIRRLRGVLAALRPDVVHVHSRRGADLYAGIAARRQDLPAVLTRRVDEREWAPWARLKYSPYAAVVAISRAVQAALVEHAGLPRSRVHVVPSGIDTDAFRPDPAARARLAARFGLPDDGIFVGVVAQLIARKGHATLLDALPGLLRPAGDAAGPVLLLCFGRGPLERRLARDIDARGLGAHVKLLGFHDDLAGLLPGLDVLAHPASAEGMGVAVLEALGAGVPVVASAVGGVTDVIEHGDSGILVPPGDARAWQQALAAIIADPEARRRVGAAGRRRVERCFTASRMVAGNLDVYRAVLGGGAVAGAPAATLSGHDPRRS